MELRQLRYFVRIVEVGSFSRASESLHIAQPALSQQIARLEQELGIQLLTRSVRGIATTAAGALLMQQARHILQQVEAVSLLASQPHQALSGVVALGLPWSVSALLGIKLLRQVRDAYPGIQLRLMEGPSWFLSEELARGRLDLAVLFDPRAVKGLVTKALLAEPLLFLAPPGTLDGAATITLRDAGSRPLLMLSRPNGIREAVDRLWEREQLKPEIVAEVNSPPVLVNAVQDGLGYTVLPASGAEDAIRAGRIDAAAIAHEDLTRTVFLATSRLFPLQPAGQAIFEALVGLAVAEVEAGRWRARLLGADADPVEPREP
ncbi:MAG TPA: LysR substrate-binding domain-containing protein [Ramlibacter sp.]